LGNATSRRSALAETAVEKSSGRQARGRRAQRRFACALTAAVAAGLIAAGGALAQVPPGVEAALPVDANQMLPTIVSDVVQTPPAALPAVRKAHDPAPPVRNTNPSASPSASPQSRIVNATGQSSLPRTATQVTTGGGDRRASSASVHRTSGASPATPARRIQPVDPRSASFARPDSALARTFEPGSGGPPRPAGFTPLWGKEPGGEALLGILRALATLGAMLALGGVLARRLTDAKPV
jgi:hypothetical protein